MTNDAEPFPAALTAIAGVEFEYGEDGGVDFYGDEQFTDPAEMTEWFRAWTGNDEVTGDAFRVFGRDGTGGLAAFWLVRDGQPVEHQPVVFLGSEGETGVVASNLSDLLWLFADGVGPCEAVTPYDEPLTPSVEVLAIAERWATPPKRSATEIVSAARAEFPHFEPLIDDLCR